MKAVKIAALKDTLSKTLRVVAGGECIVVTDRNRPVAMLMPIESEDGVTILSRKRPFASIRRRRFAATRRPIDSLALLLVERGGR